MLRPAVAAAIWRSFSAACRPQWLAAGVANGSTHSSPDPEAAWSAGGAGGARAGPRRSWARAAAVAAGAAAAAAAAAGAAHGEELEGLPRGAEQLRAEFRAWMRRQGGDLEAVAIEPRREVRRHRGARAAMGGGEARGVWRRRPSAAACPDPLPPPPPPPPSQDPSAGQALFSTPRLRAAMRHAWLGRRLGALLTGQRTLPVASAPLSLALTARAAVADPDLGPAYAELLELGLLDERSAVIAMLTVERVRGGDSRYAPWIRMLPDRWGEKRGREGAGGGSTGRAVGNAAACVGVVPGLGARLRLLILPAPAPAAACAPSQLPHAAVV
jgi:hypothetical protein